MKENQGLWCLTSYATNLGVGTLSTLLFCLRFNRMILLGAPVFQANSLTVRLPPPGKIRNGPFSCANPEAIEEHPGPVIPNSNLIAVSALSKISYQNWPEVRNDDKQSSCFSFLSVGGGLTSVEPQHQGFRARCVVGAFRKHVKQVASFRCVHRHIPGVELESHRRLPRQCQNSVHITLTCCDLMTRTTAGQTSHQ